MNINELLIYGRQFLLDTNISEIPLKVRLLAEHVLGLNKFELVVQHEKEVTTQEYELFKSGLEKIKNHTPIQYITNNQEFMKLNFYVDENVLIPQPDTEILVEEVIKHCSSIENSSTVSQTNQNIPSSNRNIRILDLCTGSGAIAISLAKYIDNCEITATDISNKALQIAKLNAEKNKVHTKINFIESDMFEKITENDFDIIVSNPPYIEKNVIPTLDKEVQKEPIIALDGGFDGLKFYKIIINNANNYLNDFGKVFLEIGYNQKNAVLELIDNCNNLIFQACIKDLSSNDRVIICKKGKEK